MNKVLTTCPYCAVGCQFYLVVDPSGELVGVEPSTAHPIARGRLCIKGWNAFQCVNHPDRLTQPMVRRNGRMEKVDWPEALDYVASRLRQVQQDHGRDSVAFFSCARATNEENFLMMKLARAGFQTNNVDHCARLCHSATVLGLAATLGSGAMTNSIQCFEKTDCYLVIGSNPTEAHPLIGARIVENVSSNGARLIVADNRKIRLARLAHIHLRHRNGSDVALINSLMHVIIAEGLENRRFIEECTEGFEELKATVANYPPRKAAEITGLDPQDIAAAARTYAAAENAMIVYCLGITQHTHGVDNVMALANLALLTGNLGKPGAGVNPIRGQNNVQGACDMGALPNVFSGYQKVDDPDAREKFRRHWRVDALPDQPGLTTTAAMNAAADGRVHALYIMGEDPMMSDPDQHHVRHALENLDLLVVQDIFPTVTSRFAHVILPATSWAEKHGTFTNTERRVQCVRQAVQPRDHARADWQILADLGRRVGLTTMNYSSPAQILEEITDLTPIYAGISLDRIDRLGLQWPCPDPQHPGTAFLYASGFPRGRARFRPAPYRPPVESPDEDYPLVLTTGRSYFHYHAGSMTRRTRLLEREQRFPYVEVSPHDARRLDIRDRAWVQVATRRGHVLAMARVTDVAHDGVIFMPFHFEEGPANRLTINALDPVADIPEYKVCAARMIPVT